jgi:hypothetical protein
MEKHSEHFARYANLCLELHRMIAAGKDESDEGEALRERMDPEWYAMTEEERQIVRGVSRDFYTIFDSKRFKFGAERDNKYIENLKKFIKNNILNSALQEIRDLEINLTEDLIAKLRGDVWAHFGFNEISVSFYKRAFSIINNDFTIEPQVA